MTGRQEASVTRFAIGMDRRGPGLIPQPNFKETP